MVWVRVYGGVTTTTEEVMMYTYFVESEKVNEEVYFNLYVSEDGGDSWEYYNWYDDKALAEDEGDTWARVAAAGKPRFDRT